MSRSVNKVILLGRLGKDPELKYTPSGQAVTKFSLATSERWKDKTSGEVQERTEWHNIVCWAKLAETASQYLSKGSSVYVEGRLQTRSWDDKENKRHYMTEVVVNELVMTGGRGEGGGKASHAAAAPGAHVAEGGHPRAERGGEDEARFGPPPVEITDDDIPF
ncbi:MAG: single-stranded DNA-binding protein [Terriglobales bacterium]